MRRTLRNRIGGGRNACRWRWRWRRHDTPGRGAGSTLRAVLVLGFLIGSGSGLEVATAVTFDLGPVFSLIEENDALADQDRHYSQGIKLSYLHADNRMPDWLSRVASRIPTVGYEPAAWRYGFSLGQSIYTPEDKRREDLIEDDRPYAGWLYGGAILQRRGLAAERLAVLENLQIELGILGEESLAEDAQNWVHGWFGIGPEVRGWAHQIETEPGLAVRYQRSWLWSPQLDAASRIFDVIPTVGASVGNVDTSIRAGTSFRLGWNLPDDFGVPTIDSLTTAGGGRSAGADARPFGAYFFTGVEGRAVGYTVFLDGNIFPSSHSVDKEALVGEWKTGLVLVFRRLDLGAVHVLRTREFVGQRHNDRYGSIVVKLKF